jgi:hypothetical protein
LGWGRFLRMAEGAAAAMVVVMKMMMVIARL